MLEVIGTILGAGICFFLYMGMNSAIEYGEREGIVQTKKDLDEFGSSSRSEAME